MIDASETKQVIYSVQPDPTLNNADKSNLKQRPFIVDKDEYPFESHWYGRDGVAMHVGVRQHRHSSIQQRLRHRPVHLHHP